MAHFTRRLWCMNVHTTIESISAGLFWDLHLQLWEKNCWSDKGGFYYSTSHLLNQLSGVITPSWSYQQSSFTQNTDLSLRKRFRLKAWNTIKSFEENIHCLQDIHSPMSGKRVSKFPGVPGQVGILKIYWLHYSYFWQKPCWAQVKAHYFCWFCRDRGGSVA